MLTGRVARRALNSTRDHLLGAQVGSPERRPVPGDLRVVFTALGSGGSAETVTTRVRGSLARARRLFSPPEVVVLCILARVRIVLIRTYHPKHSWISRIAVCIEPPCPLLQPYYLDLLGRR